MAIYKFIKCFTYSIASIFYEVLRLYHTTYCQVQSSETGALQPIINEHSD